jgi:mRNA-degrading endonuclease toxin of MazEF toxin-antitoxin module
VVFGQWSEATDGGRRPPGIVSPEPEPEPVAVTVGPGAGGMRVVPGRVEGMGLEALTPEYRRIMEIVAGADGPVMARNVALALGRETTPAKIEPVRGQLRKLSDRGWLVRTASGRYRPR